MRTRIVLVIACLLLGSAGTSSAFIDAATAKKEQAKIEEGKARDKESDARATKMLLEKAGVVTADGKMRASDYGFVISAYSTVSGVSNSYYKICGDLKDQYHRGASEQFIAAQTATLLQQRMAATFTSSSVTCINGSGVAQRGTETYQIEMFAPVSFSKMFPATGITATVSFGDGAADTAMITLDDNRGNSVSYSATQDGAPEVITAKLLIGYEAGVGASTAQNTGRLSLAKMPELINYYYAEQHEKGNEFTMQDLIVALMRDPAFRAQFLEWAEEKFDKV